MTTPVPVVSRSRALVMLVILALTLGTVAMDRQGFPVLLPAIDRHFGFTLWQGGLLATVFAFGIAAAGIPVGYLLDVWPRKSVILLGMAVFATGTLLTAAAVGFHDMVLYRVLSGVGQGLQAPALFSAVGAFYASFGLRTTSIGATGVGYALGSVAGPALAGSLLVSHGWAAPFVAYGVIALLAGAAVLFGVSDAFTERGEPRREVQSATASRVPAAIWNRNLALGIVVTVVFAVSEYGYLGLYPTFLIQQLAFTPQQAAAATSLFGAGGLLALAAGRLGDVLHQRRVILWCLLAAGGCGYLIFNTLALPWEQLLFAFVDGVLASAFLFNNLYALLQRCVRPEYVGRASGIFVTCFYVPSGLAGYLFALLVHARGWGFAALVQLALIPLVGVVAILLTREEELVEA